MKRLPMTPGLIAQIKAAVGEDVDPSGFAVFESISINSLPLPGKDGSIFEKAQISLLTLRQMADDINGGNHLPLMMDHELSGAPFGRVFKAELHYGSQGEVELRTLFYVDDTNPELAAKIDAGSLDEVSVAFLATQLLCSECEFDYRGEEATWSNFMERTCANGHAIGQDGVHLRLVGLQNFTELSLVSRGAGSKPKIVGKSASKLAAPLQALAARGFEIDELYLTASKGEVNVDLTVILGQLEAKTTEAATAKVELTAATARAEAAETALATANARIAELDEQVPAGAAELTAANEAVAEATAVLTDIYTKLAVAAGADAAAPTSIADLKAGIEANQSKLTALIPIGGASDVTKPEVGSKFDASRASAFALTR